MSYVKQNWADGSEGNTPITAARLNHIEDGFEGKLDRVLVLVSATDQAAIFTVQDDGTVTDDWPNRLEFFYDPAGPTVPRRTSFFNEYGELRIAPAKGSTVPLRLFNRENNWGPEHNEGVALFEIMDNRDDRNILFQIHNDGSLQSTSTVEADNIQHKVVCWPTGSEPSFAGEPDGTLWIEYTP